MERGNAVVAGFGPKGSGKTTFLWRHYTSRAPRVLTLDSTNETCEMDKRAIQVYGLDEVKAALRHCAKYRAWHIAAALNGPAELVSLLDLLAPPFGAHRQGYARAVGGMVLESSEIDEWLPNVGAPPEAIGAIRRGRHYRLWFYMATQRPASCARDVSAQADVLFSFAHHEPAEREFLAKTISRPVADRIAELRPHHVAVYVRDEQRVYWCDPAGKVYDVTDPRGAAPSGAERSRSNSSRRVADARRLA